MRINGKTLLLGGIAALLLFIGYQLYPTLLFQVSEWQRNFNLQLSASLNHIQQNATQAGFTLMGVSFLYGVFHAVGPGHGKFILTGYLGFEQTKLPQAIKITWLSALVQGLVAIALVTVIVVIFTLSRSYFNLALKWVERGSFAVMILFGGYWLWQARGILQSNKRLNVTKILQISPESQPLAPRFNRQPHSHSADCGCGHKHLPTVTEMGQATDWKSTAMLIFSIGLRPCTGAVLVLFLAYTLDIYYWGVLSAVAMAVGTGCTLTLFACIVLFARRQAVKVGKFYLSLPNGQRLGQIAKGMVGLLLVGIGVLLLHSSWIETSSNLLFKR